MIVATLLTETQKLRLYISVVMTSEHRKRYMQTSDETNSNEETNKYLKSCKQKCHCAFECVLIVSLMLLRYKCALYRKIHKLWVHHHHHHSNYENYNNNIINNIQIYCNETIPAPSVTSLAFSILKYTQQSKNRRFQCFIADKRWKKKRGKWGWNKATSLNADEQLVMKCLPGTVPHTHTHMYKHGGSFGGP